MRAFDPEVKDAVWAAVEGLIPIVNDPHPLGCHRTRVPDRICFEGILIRLVTGCSWVDAEALLGFVVSDTTLRARRDEWLSAGVFVLRITEIPHCRSLKFPSAPERRWAFRQTYMRVKRAPPIRGIPRRSRAHRSADMSLRCQPGAWRSHRSHNAVPRWF